MNRQTVTVFGGSGFIGRYLVRRLAGDGWRVVVAVRDPDGAGFLLPSGDVGQIVPLAADVSDPQSVAQAIENSDAVVNLVGILYERGNRNFERVHVGAAHNIGQAASANGIRNIVQVSAIGASTDAPSRYARSKAAAENTLRSHVAETIVIRPSIVFGPEDGFFNLFARLFAISPVIPLFGGGTSRMQPVYADDVASGIARCLSDSTLRGGDFELGGPCVYTFRRLMEIIRKETHRRALLVPLPYLVAQLQSIVLQYLPKPPLTPDQVKLLQIDNTVSRGARGLSDLGIKATPLELIVPTYLHRYRRGGWTGRVRTAGEVVQE